MYVVDPDMLTSLKELLGDKFVQLVHSYLKDCESRVKKIQLALDSMDLDVIRVESHGIKGSSRNMGANPLADICSELEKDAGQGVTDGMGEKIAAIEQQFAAVAIELHKLL